MIEFSIREDMLSGLAAAVCIDGYDIIHLYPGSMRNTACLPVLMDILQSSVSHEDIGRLLASAKNETTLRMDRNK